MQVVCSFFVEFSLQTAISASGSSLNSLLSQPTDGPAATYQQQGVVSGRQAVGQSRLAMMSAAQQAHHQQMLQQQQQQQQQPHQSFERPVDRFTAGMNKLMEDFIKLEKDYGREKFHKAMCEVRPSFPEFFY